MLSKWIDYNTGIDVIYAYMDYRSFNAEYKNIDLFNVHTDQE